MFRLRNLRGWWKGKFQVPGITPFKWTIFILVTIVATAIIIPPETAWMGESWYARPDNAHLDNLDSGELAFALTWIVVWIAGMVVIGIFTWLEKRNRH